LLSCAGVFEACRGVTYCAQPLMLYLLPFMLLLMMQGHLRPAAA
jgi:hypothetical protein